MSTANYRLTELLGGGGREEADADATAVLLKLIESGNISIDKVKEAAHAVKNDSGVIDLFDEHGGDEQQRDSEITTASASTVNTDIKAEDEQTVCDEESPGQSEQTQILKPLYEICCCSCCVGAKRELGVYAVTPQAEAGGEHKSKRRKIDGHEQDKTSSVENDTDVEIEGQNDNTFGPRLHGGRGQALRKSCLISRKQLACLTGGKVNEHRNPLNVGTPISYTGGAAMAKKDDKIHHLCMKEEMNHPYPSTDEEQFIVYRKAPSESGKHQKDVELLIKAHPNHPPIPIFWEPTDQSGSTEVAKIFGAPVMYIGHWKVAQIEDLKGREEMYLGHYRCAKIYLDFSYFDERWEEIIRRSHDQTIEQIK
ncbi:hypothetical protein ACHAWT_000628, partial [Skeletonema menzelii]